jgi:integrase/recombinase XerD
MNFHTASTNYLNHLRIERALATNTIESYQRDLAKFALFLNDGKKDFAHLTPSHVEAFEVFLKETKISGSSINRCISALKGFYRYCALEYEISNPMTESTTLKTPRRLPKALSISEITSLIESAKREGDPISLRDCAILEILYSTGARVSEVIGINFSDIATQDLDGERISVVKLRGKGSKERIVPLGKFAFAALDEYLVRTRPLLAAKNAKSESALFLNSRGKRLSRQSAWQIVLDAAHATGLGGKVSPHVFRHSYATHLLDGGADIRVVQELLGHSSVTTTQIYTLITIDKVRESYSSAHPRAK